MRYAIFVVLAACATGAHPGGGGDAADDVDDVDAAALDGAVTDAAELDAPVDAPQIDAAVIDAAVTDAAAIDAPQIDAAVTDAAAIDAPQIDAAVTDAAVTDARIIDAAAIDARVIDAGPIDGGGGGPTDTCAQARDLTLDASQAGGTTVSGSTVGYANDVAPATTCTGYTTSGPDAVYRVALAAGQTLTATATPAIGYDVSLMLVTPCAASPTCLAGDDNGLSGAVETVAYTATAAITAYVVVDGYTSNIVGSYSLVVRIQ